MPAEYPARLAIAYPDRQLNRLTTFFRPILVIPIVIILALLAGGGSGAENQEGNLSLAGLVVLPVLLFILFRLKYPRWWFDWNLALSRFSLRVASYCLLLDDTYPSAEDEQAVRLDLDYPNASQDLNRWLPLVKWFLAIPHIVILILLDVAALCVALVAWFAILFTGRYPRGMFDFVVGVLRWNVRVGAYGFLLITDKYPPFSL